MTDQTEGGYRKTVEGAKKVGQKTAKGAKKTGRAIKESDYSVSVFLTVGSKKGGLLRAALSLVGGSV